jgi:hypothetical protein
MKRIEALGVVLVAVLSGGLLVGCTSENAPTATSASPGPATPSIAATPGGSITVALAGLAGHEGEHVAGVLLKDLPGPGQDYTGVAGFVTTIDADPFTQQLVLGNVSDDYWPPEADGIGWPWPTGVADVPPGVYTLKLWAVEDNTHCSYPYRPAPTPGITRCRLRCQLRVTATGTPQTITITGFPISLAPICTVK